MKKLLTIIGLGAGDLDQLPFGVYKKLKDADNIFLRTKEHPVVEQLTREGIQYESFDYIYEKHDQFEAVYDEIVDFLLQAVKERDVIYAVPGHPMVAEKTVQLLLELGEKQEIEVSILGGQSFLDAMFTVLKIDPIEGFQLLDATSLNKEDVRMNQHMIIVQVYDSFIASEVKLTLMEKYPDDYEVVIVTGAGSSTESVRRVPLYELDRQVELNNLTSLYVPPVNDWALTYKDFSTLREIIATLRGPNGCPWDKKQTHLTLKKYLIEETYELLAAIDRDDIDNMIEELGDVLLQIMLHSQIAEDEGMFTVDDVIETISSKMIHRHPHVFGDVEVKDSDEVVANWEKIKAAEKPLKAKRLLDQTGKGLPALLKAYEIQKAAGKVGFDWNNAREAWEKVKEEMQEFEKELTNDNKQEQIREIGDLLFAIINVARILKVHPEESLQATNEKFYQRFAFVEDQVRESGKSFEEFSLEELDRFWDEAKQRGL